MAPLPSPQHAEGLSLSLFGPTFQNPVADSGLEGSRLWSVEAEERRVSGLAWGSMKGGGCSVIFFFNGFQQGSL